MYQPTLLPAAKLKRLLQILEGIKAGSIQIGCLQDLALVGKSDCAQGQQARAPCAPTSQ